MNAIITPNRQVTSRLGLYLVEYKPAVDIYDDIPDYGGRNEPEGFQHIRSMIHAAFLCQKGYRIREIHRLDRAEGDFQFIFSGQKVAAAETTDHLYFRIERIVKELAMVLGEAWPREVTFRFRDLVILNPGRPKVRRLIEG